MQFKIYHNKGSLTAGSGKQATELDPNPIIIETDDETSARVIFKDLMQTKMYGWKIKKIEK